MKLSISLDDELVKRIDDYADETYMSRSALISLACSQYLNTNQMVKAITDMSIAVVKISEDKKITPEMKKELKQIKLFAEMLMKSQQGK